MSDPLSAEEQLFDFHAQYVAISKYMGVVDAVPTITHAPKCKPDWPFYVCPICYPDSGFGVTRG